MRNALGTVYQNQCAMFMGSPRHILHGIDSAQNVGDLCNTNQSGSWGKEFLIFIQQQFAVVVHGDNFQRYTFAPAQQLPRNDIGMMLHG